MRPASLNATQREHDLDHLHHHVPDVLVIGGGITGVGVALEAVTRGLSVTLVERDDLAFGTSRWSSKLIHGGLRYLRNADIGVAWESARERHILMHTTAPHLVRALPFMVPLSDVVSVPYGVLSGAGVRAGNVLRLASGSSGKMLPGPHRISALEARQLVPGLQSRGLRGGLLFWDGQAEDDARIVITVARTAAAYGARIITRCAVTHIEAGEVFLEDRFSNAGVLSVRPKYIINAAGVWADTLSPTVHLRPSKGSHLVVRREAFGSPRAAMMVPVPDERARWVGATPTHDGHVIVGVTDTAYDGPIEDQARVTADEREYLLSLIDRVLQHPIAEADIIGSYAGYRPLLSSPHSSSTADISRRHALIDDASSQMTTIVGGKFTTYRKMAEDTVDHVVAVTKLPASRSRTARLPIAGAAAPGIIDNLPVPERLKVRYGVEATQVHAIGKRHPELMETVSYEPAVLGVELAWGVQHEGALTVDDLLDRRVRLDLVPEQRAVALPHAKEILSQRSKVAVGT